MINQKDKNKYKKIITSIILFVFVFSLIVPIFQPVQAQMVTHDPITLAFEKIWNAIHKAMKFTNDLIYKLGLSGYLNNLAAEMGTYYATGGKGAKPLFVTDQKEWRRQVRDGVVGDYINNIAKKILGGTCAWDPKQKCKKDVDCTSVMPPIDQLPAEDKLLIDKGDVSEIITKIEAGKYGKDRCIIKGFDLCEVDLQARARMIGGVKAEFEEYKSKCPLNKMEEHYKELKDRKFPEDWIDFQKYFNPEANDVGVHLALTTQIIEQQNNKEKTEEADIVEGTFSLKDTIAGWVKTPAGRLNPAFDNINTKSTKSEEKQTGTPAADVFGIFFKSFASKWLKLLFDKGLSPKPDPKNFSDSSSTASWTSIKEAQKIYSSIFTTPIISGGNYDILSNYLTCPEDLNFSQVDNCVLNQEMGPLLQNNERISFQDAIDKNKEDSSKYNWINLPVGKDKSGAILGKGDQDKGFSLENIKKMRKARIVPLGLELAAKKIVDSSDIKSKTLKEIVEKFNDNSKVCSNDQDKTCANDTDCSDNGVCAIQSFYHLVDPNWILKIPQHECGAKVFGPVLEASESFQRNQVCADLKSCLKEDADGNCQGAFGYCVREKNIWRFNGDQCPERFNTCQTFQKENESVSYLKNTLDFNGCDSSNAGCLWYSKPYVKGKEKCNKDFEICKKEEKTTCDAEFKNCNEKNEDNSFLEDNRIYFNKNIQTCNSKDDGCHEFIQLSNIKDGLTNREVLKQVQDAEEKNDDYSNYAIVNKIYLNKNRIECNEANAGCEKYTPTNGDSWVPGIIKAENICPQECVGYKTYHQLGTNFEIEKPNANDLSYVYLIPNGRQCSANEVGCDEFTNLDEVAKGGEGKEYYTYLRQCVKTNEPSCGVFYTWVGSDTQGFQIKAYNLQKDTDGSPKTTDTPMNLGSCRSEADAMNNPECKEFFDGLGNAYYRIYKKTITCSEDCHPLRKTEDITNESDCKKYGGTWETDRCIFMAIPKEGTTCSSNSAGCRAYRGNHGDNIRIILQDDFEDKDSEGWDNAEIKAEASVIGGSSIKSKENNLISSSEGIMPDLLIQNRSYELSFWAKSGSATKEDVKARFSNGVVAENLSFGQQKGQQKVSSEWNKYTFGPLLFNRAVSAAERLEIAGNLYVDNIILKEITNDIYLIKNSWNIPASCDQTLNQQALPQAMLNCAEYQDRRGAFQYLKSFASICNEKFIGCQTLIDTQNSTSPYEQTINGKTINKDALAYYVNNPLNYCLSQEKGCESFGLPTLDVNGVIKKDKDGKQIWKDVYLKDNPDQYKTIICSSDEMSCQEYKYNGNAVAYFKDPKEKVCEYKLVFGQKDYGWYKKGTEAGEPNCEQGWARICPSNQSGCTEFIDPLDNQSFYYLNNDKIDRNSPNGLVSKKEGKILFNDTSKKELIYDAEETYRQSEMQGKAVSPIGCNASKEKCTANSIIKVDRDRVCGQWLSCISNSRITVQGKEKNICNQIGFCREFEEGAYSGCGKWVTLEEGKSCSNDLECLSGRCVIEAEKGTCEKTNEVCFKNSDCSSKRCLKGKCGAITLLDEENYTKRNISWEGLDYSGYSIPNQYPIFALKQLDYQRVNQSCLKDSECLSGKCINNKCAISPSPILRLAYGYPEAYQCSKDSDCLSGICANGKCAKETIKPISKSCRGYPEATSPFPMSMANQDGFQNANTCSQKETDNACECTYKKVETMDWNTAYFSSETMISKGICVEGDFDKIKTSCSLDLDCGTKGQCSTVRKINTYLGWRGYCLESDHQGNCITWYPIDLIKDENDSFSSDFRIADMQTIDPDWKENYCAKDDSYTQTKIEYKKIYCHKKEGKKDTFSISPPAPKAGLDYRLVTCEIDTKQCYRFKNYCKTDEQIQACKDRGGQCIVFGFWEEEAQHYCKEPYDCPNRGDFKGTVGSPYSSGNNCNIDLSCNGSTFSHGEAWAYLKAVYKINYCKEVAYIPTNNTLKGSGIKLQVYKDYKANQSATTGYHKYPDTTALAYSYETQCTPFGAANSTCTKINQCQTPIPYYKDINCSTDAGSKTSYKEKTIDLRKLFVKGDFYSFSPPEITTCLVSNKSQNECEHSCLTGYTFKEYVNANDTNRCSKIEEERCISELDTNIKKGYESGCYSSCTSCTPCSTCTPPVICPVCPDTNKCPVCPDGFNKRLLNKADALSKGYTYGIYNYETETEISCDNSEGLCVCEKDEPVEGYFTNCLETGQTENDCLNCPNGFIKQLYSSEEALSHGFRQCKNNQQVCVCKIGSKDIFPTSCQEESKLASDCPAPPERGFKKGLTTYTNAQAEAKGWDKCQKKEKACICKAGQNITGYQKTTDSWDDMALSGTNPLIHQAGQLKPGDLYTDQGPGIMINNKKTGTFTGKNYFNAILTFFAMADPNQVPIRKIKIDWDDGTSSDMQGSYLNHVADKITEKEKYCKDPNICTETPFIFVKTYIEKGTYIPKVTVTDSWGKETTVISGVTIEVK